MSLWKYYDLYNSVGSIFSLLSFIFLNNEILINYLVGLNDSIFIFLNKVLSLSLIDLKKKKKERKSAKNTLLYSEPIQLESK